MAGFLPSSFWHIYGMRQSLSQQKCQKRKRPTSSHLGDDDLWRSQIWRHSILHYTLFPRLSIAPPTPSSRPQNDPDALAQGKIRFHDCNDKMIFVSD